MSLSASSAFLQTSRYAFWSENPIITGLCLMDYFHIFNQQTSRTGELNVYLNANQMTLEAGRSHFIAERIKIKRFWQKFVV